MKKLFILGFVALLFACNPKPIAKVHGSVNNPTSGFITISSTLLDSSDSLMIKDGIFTGEIAIEQPGVYYLKDGNYGFTLYLKPGSDLNICFDVQQLKNGDFSHIEISGKGNQESTLMKDLKAFDISKNMRQILSLSSDSFEVTVKENYNQIVQSIDSFKNMNVSSEHFYTRIDLIKKIEMCEKYMYYTLYHKRLAPNDTLPIPETFYQVGNDIPLDNEMFYKELNTYKYFVLQKHDSNIQSQLEKEHLDNESVEYANKQIDLIKALSASQDVKDYLGNSIISSYTYANDDVKEIYKKRYPEIIKNEKYINDFKALLVKLEALKPGSKAPTFSYSDMNGKTINSDDLKGKVIYVDVWATWCGPCKGEIPYLKALEEELHDLDIAFVSISVDGDKEAWQNMVEEKQLKGYQLHAEKEWDSDIIKNYAIKGIPRFILIDKEGKLINANAKRPSDKETKNKLIELAKA